MKILDEMNELLEKYIKECQRVAKTSEHVEALIKLTGFGDASFSIKRRQLLCLEMAKKTLKKGEVVTGLDLGGTTIQVKWTGQEFAHLEEEDVVGIIEPIAFEPKIRKRLPLQEGFVGMPAASRKEINEFFERLGDFLKEDEWGMITRGLSEKEVILHVFDLKGLGERMYDVIKKSVVIRHDIK